MPWSKLSVCLCDRLIECPVFLGSGYMNSPLHLLDSEKIYSLLRKNERSSVHNNNKLAVLQKSYLSKCVSCICFVTCSVFFIRVLGVKFNQTQKARPAACDGMNDERSRGSLLTSGWDVWGVFFSTSTRPANSAFSFPYRVRSRNKVGSYISLPLANRSRYCENSVYCSGREKHMMQFLVVLTSCALRQEQGLLASQHEHNIVKNGRRGTSGSPTAWNAFSKTISGAHTSSWRLQHKHKGSDWLGCVGVFNLSSYILLVRARVCVCVYLWTQMEEHLHVM